jgi:hypothetical protein
MRTGTSLARIYADEQGLKHRILTERLIGIFFGIYNELGYGFLESVYEQAFAVSLAEHGIVFQKQVALPVFFHGHQIGDFRADLFVSATSLQIPKRIRDHPRRSAPEKFLHK